MTKEFQEALEKKRQALCHILFSPEFARLNDIETTVNPNFTRDEQNQMLVLAGGIGALSAVVNHLQKQIELSQEAIKTLDARKGRT